MRMVKGHFHFSKSRFLSDDFNTFNSVSRLLCYSLSLNSQTLPPFRFLQLVSATSSCRYSRIPALWKGSTQSGSLNGNLGVWTGIWELESETFYFRRASRDPEAMIYKPQFSVNCQILVRQRWDAYRCDNLHVPWLTKRSTRSTPLSVADEVWWCILRHDRSQWTFSGYKLLSVSWEVIIYRWWV